MTITTQEYKQLDDAYTFFNNNLFSGELPECIITFHRHKKSQGFFWFEKYSSRIDNDDRISELGLNPDTFSEKTDMDILATMCHELCHCWQHYLSEPSRKNYHDKEFARKMIEIGLMPSNTGEIGGKTTGAQMTHYIIKDGLFEKYCQEFLKNARLNWQSIPVSKNPSKEKKQTRAKYTCPKCEQNCWGKYNANFMCGDCKISMEILD